MRTIAIGDLRERTSEVSLLIKSGETIEITEDGETIAHLVPAWRPAHQQGERATWTNLDALVEEISKYLPEHVDAVEAVREIRRDL